MLWIVFAFSCQGELQKENIRIAVARFSHETCTFCPRPTTIEDWEYYRPPTRDLFESERGYIGGFKRMCDDFGGVELVGILSPRGARGGPSGSWITREAFDKYSGLIVDDLKKAGHLDGVFFSLHRHHGTRPAVGESVSGCVCLFRLRLYREDITQNR
ncbi:MAG: M81 family metallopeptidase [Candidatus Aminicenantes bacterium]